MKKDIKDMTLAEKQARIEHLSHKFDDINNDRPSFILISEMRGIKPDDYLATIINTLETLEIRHYNLEQEYTNVIAPELRRLKRVFEYEYEQLMRKHEREDLVPPFDPFRKNNRAETAKRHKQEIEYMKRCQNDTKTRIEEAARAKLTVCDNQIRTTFMNAVKYLYR